MSGHSSSSTFHDFHEFIIPNYQKSGILNFKNSKNGQLRFPKIRKFSNLKVNTSELLSILFSTHSYYLRLIHGLIASFLAFCSALGSWLMAGSSLVARRSAGPGPGKGNVSESNMNESKIISIMIPRY